MASRRKIPEADRHLDGGPVSFRASKDTKGWLEDIAAREGRARQAIVGDAVERARAVDEAGLAALDREQTRAFMAWAKTHGKEELAAFEAVHAAYLYAIRHWQPDSAGETA